MTIEAKAKDFKMFPRGRPRRQRHPVRPQLRSQSHWFTYTVRDHLKARPAGFGFTKAC